MVRDVRPQPRARCSADGVTQGGATGVLAASIFHFGEFTVAAAKQHMASRGISVRPAGA